MRIGISAVGRLKAGPERELADRYAERFSGLARGLGLSGPVITEVPESQARSAAERKAQEAQAILAALPADTFAVRLDEGGKSIDSAAFAGWISRERDSGRRAMSFVIGGADGLGPALEVAAKDVISFGSMTMPHQIVRVLLLEQLYRAATILAGHPYHRP
ncbi:MAG: 23S rRNA (pseudouridine(1915)-N(3))-methyltransferase RlmH [Beijerinckiaceae bacterium]